MPLNDGDERHQRVLDPHERLAIERNRLINDRGTGLRSVELGQELFVEDDSDVFRPGASLSGLAARTMPAGSPTTSPSTHAATSRTVIITSNLPRRHGYQVGRICNRSLHSGRIANPSHLPLILSAQTQ